MLSIGLTGGIASGKSLVSGRFNELGTPVIDADVLAREVVRPGTPSLAWLRSRFGKHMITNAGELDRARLREVIFSSDRHRREVEAVLHPAIRALSEARSNAAQAEGHAYLIHAIPLLVETGQQARFDRVLVVDLPVDTQLERLMQRDDTDQASAERILAAQASREERLAVADDVILNDGSVADTLARVDELDEQYRAIARANAGRN